MSPDRADLTPISVNYDEVITFSFRSQPTTFTMAYEIYKSIFIQKPEALKIISKLHQNNFQDVLHFSVQIVIANNWINTLHYNGMWDGNRFILDNITAIVPNKIMETIAQFN
jgi:hypothetical protein